MKESQSDILQKLNSNGECLQSSASKLLLEMKVLNKLIYKYRNAHSKEKFFKCLERVSPTLITLQLFHNLHLVSIIDSDFFCQIKKCVNKWKLLHLDFKVITLFRIVGCVNFTII
jgi:hypothetical protein